MRAWAVSLALISVLTLKWVTSCAKAESEFCDDPEHCSVGKRAWRAGRDAIDSAKDLQERDFNTVFKAIDWLSPPPARSKMHRRDAIDSPSNELLNKWIHNGPGPEFEENLQFPTKRVWVHGRSSTDDLEPTKRVWVHGRSSTDDLESPDKRQFYRFGRAAADDSEIPDMRQYFRFGRSSANDGDSMNKRGVHRFGRNLADGSQIEEKRQFYRFGRDIGQPERNTYTDKRFLRFGRSASFKDMTPQEALQDLLADQAGKDSGERKRRSLEEEAQSSDHPEHNLLKRSRRAAVEEQEADDESLEHREMAKRDADMSDMEARNHDIHPVEKRAAERRTKLMKFGKRFMRFGKKNIKDFDDLADKRFMRFGKRFMRFGRAQEVPDKRFMRFGRSFDDFADKRFIRFGKRADEDKDFSDKRFMRFGRDFLGKNLNDFADKRFMRFGRNYDDFADKRFMRFGRTPAGSAELSNGREAESMEEDFEKRSSHS